MNLLESAGLGLALGFSLAVPPGPMNALIASVSTRSSRAGTVTAFGAMSSDMLLGALVFSLNAVVDLREIVRPVDALGAVVLAYFGIRILTRREDPNPPTTSGVRTFSQGLALGLTNPFQILWWLTAGLAFARLGGPVLLVGLFGAVGTWVVVFPYAIHAGARRYPKLRSGVAIVSAGIMLAFAAYFAALAL
jgi:threonine/homoserine/homoserine lactone efflux protein